ncbi:hypothetical protein Hte_000058 [Hypoxylon texense]
MKIIIVGAGLGGLTTAIALRKYIPASQPLEIKIYDNTNPDTDPNTQRSSHKVSTSRLGAGLGLQANGLRVLEDLDPALKQRVFAAGFPCTHFTWKTAGNWLLGREYAHPLIRQCQAKASLDNIYPIFVMPDLPYWGRDGCVLVGDAAHALPPRSGQGASQAFEDGEALALLLAGYLEKEHSSDDAISQSILGLFEVRAERVNGIKADALRWKDPKMPMSRLQTFGLYIALFLLVRVRRLTNLFSRRET